MNLNLTLVAQIVSFSLFIWFTVKLVWPHMLRAIETRQKTIADGLAAAEQGRKSLETSTKQADEEIKRARDRAAEIISQAEKRATQMVDEANRDIVRQIFEAGRRREHRPLSRPWPSDWPARPETRR